jgi:N-acetylglucosaminyl-diphospho-decaprenol L-rhamnosyltransferase
MMRPESESSMAKVAVVVVSWNTRALLEECLESILATTAGQSVEIVVVDNASTDGTREMLSDRHPRVQLIANDRNEGFSRANNQAARAIGSDYLLLLNSDARLLPQSLQEMVHLLDLEPAAAVVGAQLLNPDGTFQASCSSFPGLLQEFLILTGLGRLLKGREYPSQGPDEERGARRVDYIEGACLLARRQAYLQVGGMDETYFMYSEEVDLCYSVKRAGWDVWYQPAARVIHLGGASSRHRATAREADLYRSRIQFFRKYRGPFQAALLKGLIYSVTLAKQPLHAALRTLSGGRRGRAVVGWRELRASLREV